MKDKNNQRPQDTFISGFMIVKNVVSQGYPFLEAIAAALPVCGEFLVSDGCSTDETWRALQALQKKHPEKLRLFQDPWPGGPARGAVIADMTNVLKQRCRGPYCFNLQANEIIHEASLAEINALPRAYPRAELFSLPFSSMMGSTILWMTEFRRRLFKNSSWLKSKGDGYDVGPVLAGLLSRPAKLIRYARYGTRGHICYLTRPVYRYRALFPDNYLAKLAALKNPGNRWSREYSHAEKTAQQVRVSGGGPEDFWAGMRSYFETDMFENLPPGCGTPEYLPRGFTKEIETAPAIMGHLVGKWRYRLLDSLEALAIKI